jgi:putative tricarboxylic transport membrane protein
LSILDNFAAGLAVVGSLDAILALIAGVAVGVVAGAVPGMSATMAVALTLPFTFSMRRSPAFCCCSASTRAASSVARSRRS